MIQGADIVSSLLQAIAILNTARKLRARSANYRLTEKILKIAKDEGRP